jgi:hypothetical protein
VTLLDEDLDALALRFVFDIHKFSVIAAHYRCHDLVHVLTFSAVRSEFDRYSFFEIGQACRNFEVGFGDVLDEMERRVVEGLPYGSILES